MDTTSLRTELWKLSKVLYDPQGFYAEIMEASDPRVADWPLMQSPFPTLGLTLLYLLFVFLGPRIMKNREPFDMKPFLFAFNAAIVALNAWIFLELTIGMYNTNHNMICTPMTFSTDEAHVKVASAIWWYYFSKCIEFSDTVFFILRKKDEQVTFLHVYHHASMFNLWWIGVKWVAGGQSIGGAWINCFVHVIMYSYYALSALGPWIRPYLWWKRHITHLQLVQFSVAIIHCCHSLYIDCNFPKWMHYTLIGYATSFIILFTNFYIHAYVKRKRKKGPGGRPNKSPLANGTASLPVQNGGINQKDKVQ